MGSPVTSADFRKVVEGHVLNVVEQEFKSFASLKDKFFTVVTDEKAFIDFFSVSGAGDIPEFVGMLTDLPIYPGFYTKIEPREFAARMAWERKVLDDKQYKIWNDRGKILARSWNRTEEKMTVQPYTTAFSTAYSFHTSEEGVAMCSNSHLTKSGTSTTNGFDNLGTSALSKTSVAATRLAHRLLRDDISQRIDMPSDISLVVPGALEEAGWEIVKTKQGLDTAEGNENFHYGRYELEVIDRLDDTSTTDWFLSSRSMRKDAMVWFDRIRPDPGSRWDYDTMTFYVWLYARVGWGLTDWRHSYGNNVA